MLGACAKALPDQPFFYLGDHNRGPYGNRSEAEILKFTTGMIETLFGRGIRLAWKFGRNRRGRSSASDVDRASDTHRHPQQHTEQRRADQRSLQQLEQLAAGTRGQGVYAAMYSSSTTITIEQSTTTIIGSLSAGANSDATQGGSELGGRIDVAG